MGGCVLALGHARRKMPPFAHKIGCLPGLLVCGSLVRYYCRLLALALLLRCCCRREDGDSFFAHCAGPAQYDPAAPGCARGAFCMLIVMREACIYDCPAMQPVRDLILLCLALQRVRCSCLCSSMTPVDDVVVCHSPGVLPGWHTTSWTVLKSSVPCLMLM